MVEIPLNLFGQFQTSSYIVQPVPSSKRWEWASYFSRSLILFSRASGWIR